MFSVNCCYYYYTHTKTFLGKLPLLCLQKHLHCFPFFNQYIQNFTTMQTGADPSLPPPPPFFIHCVWKEVGPFYVWLLSLTHGGSCHSLAHFCVYDWFGGISLLSPGRLMGLSVLLWGRESWEPQEHLVTVRRDCFQFLWKAKKT